MKNKIALITGVTGQDGSYLAELLISKGYEVHGLKRRSSVINTQRIDHLYSEPQIKSKQLSLYYSDLTDSLSLINIINKIKPDEIYNLAAMSHVHVSFQLPEYTANADALGTLRILEAIRMLNLENKCKFYQASTSELYGKVQSIPQDENTPFYPRSPYGVAKLYSYWIAKNYREAYGIFASNGILFNHESPRRGETFVTKKIVSAAVNIIYGKIQCMYLGNLDAKRDWGHAKDYVYGMYLIMQNSKPDDYVLATGKTTSIRDFISMVFKYIGIEIKFKGTGKNEVGYVFRNNSDFKLNEGSIIVKIDDRYFRPTEVDLLIGDYSKAKKDLGWEPKYQILDLIKDMVDYELKLFENEKK